MKEFSIGCFSAIVLVLLAPLLYFAGGCFTGMVLKWFVGDAVVNGLNLLFDTTRFTTEMLPVTCGALGVIGSFFKTMTSTKKD